MLKSALILIYTFLLFSCQNPENRKLAEENRELKTSHEAQSREIEKLQKENQKVSSQLYDSITELKELKKQSQKELVEDLMNINWDEVIGKMKAWNMKELQENSDDLIKNTQGTERANKHWIDKQFTDLSNQERLTPEERNRRKMENEYLKLFFIYKLARTENILLMPTQLEGKRK